MFFWIIIGGSFYRLADRYNKNKWLYLFMGIGLAAGIQFLIGIIYYLLAQPTEAQEKGEEMVLNIVALVFSGIITYFVYNRIKSKAELEEFALMDTIDNIGKDAEQTSEQIIEKTTDSNFANEAKPIRDEKDWEL
jgi:amino acid transporter